MISKTKNGEGIILNIKWDKAASLPKLFIIEISTAGTIPTKGPTMGIRFESPAIIEIKKIKVMFAPYRFNINNPKNESTATLEAAKNCPVKYLDICFSILCIIRSPTSKYLFGIIDTSARLK